MNKNFLTKQLLSSLLKISDKVYQGTKVSTSLDPHLSHHNTKREACLSLLFLKIRTHEWTEGKLIIIAAKNKLYFSIN